MQNLSSSIDELREDHARLCGELEVLKRAEVCARLSAVLREHILREERLLVFLDRSVGAAVALESMIRPSSNHFSDYRYLQVMTRCIASENRPFLLRSRYLLLTNFMCDLNHNVQEQEAKFFPFLELEMAIA
jgi:hypothetical protein